MFVSTQVAHWLNFRKWHGEPIADSIIPETESFMIMTNDLEKDFFKFRETYTKLFNYTVLFSTDLLLLWVANQCKEDVYRGQIFGKKCYLLNEDQFSQFQVWIMSLLSMDYPQRQEAFR